MSLLEKATLITTPTAHSNGTLHSIKGGAVADFDVVRGSAATRVNAEGLIEDISILSGEQVTNGDFSNGGAGWGFAGGATISDGKANIAGDGSAFTNITQTGVFTSGKQYVVKLDVIINSGLGLKFQDAVNNANIGFATTSGTYTFNFTATSNSTLMIGRRTGGTAFDSSIDNISIKEVIDATNIPRIDYTTGEGVVLLEPQSTNLITYSEDFSHSSWSKGGNISIDSGYLAPDGTNNATKITSSDLTGFLSLGGFLSSTTKSIYARSVSGTGTVKLLSKNDNTNNTFTLTEQWQRFDVNNTTTAPTLMYGVDFRNDATLNEIILWGANATNDQDYATSYIPTSGAIATRLADSVTGAGDVNTFNSTEGVLYVEMAALDDDLSGREISLNNGTTNDRIQMYFDTLSNKVSVFYKSQSGATTFILSHTLADITQFNKLAFKWKENDFALWSNGVEVATQTSGVTSIANTLTRLDFRKFNNTDKFYGKVKALAVFNEALTDSELECLTKI